MQKQVLEERDAKRDKLSQDKAKKILEQIIQDLLTIEASWYVGSSSLFNKREKIVRKKLRVSRYIDRMTRKNYNEETYLEKLRERSKEKDRDQKRKSESNTGAEEADDPELIRLLIDLNVR